MTTDGDGEGADSGIGPSGLDLNDADWLRHVHGRYVDRFISDNNRIWTTASIFLPVSLATFAAFFSVQHRSWVQAVAFGGVSSVLAIFWNILADKHRIFQDRSRYIFEQIEKAALGEALQKIVREAEKESPNPKRPKPTVREARLSLVCLIPTAWLVIVVVYIVQRR